MFTSNFARSSNHPDAVAISQGVPRWYTGRRYIKLSPSRELLKITDDDLYTKRYKAEVLALLDPKEVYRELGENAILLCWEKAGDFCHRRLVAEWLEQALGIDVPEIEPVTKRSQSAPKKEKPSTVVVQEGLF